MVDAELTNSVVQEWGLEYTVLAPLPISSDTAWRLPSDRDDMNLVAFHRNGSLKFRQTTKHDWREEVHFDTSGVVESYRFVSKRAGMRHERDLDHSTGQLTETTLHRIQLPSGRYETKKLPPAITRKGNKLFARHEVISTHDSLGTLISNYVSNDTTESVIEYAANGDTVRYSCTHRTQYVEEENTTIDKGSGVRLRLEPDTQDPSKHVYVIWLNGELYRSGRTELTGFYPPGLVSTADELMRRYKCGEL